MAIFYSDSGSFADLEVSGSGSNIFVVSGSTGGLLGVSDLTAGANVFQITSASINLFTIDQSKNINISGSVNITGSLSLNGSDIGSGGGGGGTTYNYFNPQDAYIQVAGQLGQGSLFMQPSKFPDVQFDRIVFPINYSNASNSSNSFTVSMWLGFYTRSSATMNLLSSFSTSYNITNNGTVGSYSLYAGMRLLSIGLGSTGTLPEDQYYIGMLSRTTTGGGAGMSLSNMLASQINSSFSGIFGQASAATAQYTRGLGMYSATLSSLPSSIGFSQLTGNSSAYLRQPLFYVVNGTF